jgi:hypothetical protein
MEQDHPVTRREFEAGLASFKTELKNELVEMMRNIETNLLTAFHGFARSNGVRLNAMDVTDRELRLRMDELENRMLNLELRRPPSA